MTVIEARSHEWIKNSKSVNDKDNIIDLIKFREMNEVIDEEIIKKNVFLNIMTKMPENIIENAKETFKNLSKGTNMLTLK